MPFEPSSQEALLTARLTAALKPIDGGEASQKIAKAVVQWFQQDVLPQLLVPPGIPTAGGPTNQVTVAPGMIK